MVSPAKVVHPKIRRYKRRRSESNVQIRDSWMSACLHISHAALKGKEGPGLCLECRQFYISQGCRQLCQYRKTWTVNTEFTGYLCKEIRGLIAHPHCAWTHVSGARYLLWPDYRCKHQTHWILWWQGLRFLWTAAVKTQADPIVRI